ncbi:hypothetical protein BTH42_26045 [Burkholderia sp. SRS-W-2-2016]|uniref:hypothetical protein n=1 Tax=Burkholderia sp. SRS-W-2-2016 TaxID=1926878 RepID=UPI00094B1CE3|nr:hypothetical protein [Burkholderia sp. SRS-W-2-2016]OLL28689.1 hypothetical protein BTH42_26045 [Burkholderia sp. SRS-W-2-2016]
MSVIAETKALRRQIRALAAKPDWDLLARYDLLGKKTPPTLHERVWRRIRRLLASVGLISPHVTRYPWLSTLKHRPVSADVKTVMIWALGADRHQLRAACEGLSKKLQGGDDLAPVLVTDIADFAFYSRLGWLVEYVPSLSGEGPSLQQRKQAYLAWRYRDAMVVPLSAGLASDAEWHALLKSS